MDVQSRINYYKSQFEPQFKKYFSSLEKSFKYPKNSSFVPYCLRLIKDLSLRGGKRQRIALLYESYKLFGLKPHPSLIDCALSIELLQTHLLIHDDLIDNSPLRRGKPTTFFDLKNFLKKLGLSEEYALGLTILSGDIAAYLALDALKNSKLDPEIVNKIIQIQVDAGVDTFVGQIFDIERDSLHNLLESDLFELADFKAVRSSVFAPMSIGLVLANADTKVNLSRIKRYSRNVGIAGQLQDDVLGMFGDPKITGKSDTQDIREGKRTLLITKTLIDCSGKEREFLGQVLGNRDATLSEIGKVKSIVMRYKEDEYVKSISRIYASKAAEEAASWNDFNKEPVEFFVQSADWFISRKL